MFPSIKKARVHRWYGLSRSHLGQGAIQLRLERSAQRTHLSMGQILGREGVGGRNANVAQKMRAATLEDSWSRKQIKLISRDWEFESSSPE